MCCLYVCDSQAVVVDQMMYISGIIGNNPATATLVPGGIEPEADQVSTFAWIYSCNASHSPYSYTLIMICPSVSWGMGDLWVKLTAKTCSWFRLMKKMICDSPEDSISQ